MVKDMKVQVKETVYNELTITKSKFLTYLFPVSSLEEIKFKLEDFKEKYKDANHVCFAYILDENTFKYYDDGEPASTAGAPIYQALKNNNLVYTMCVVIRYFGGTKLGVGGLIKAYTNSCLEALKKATIANYEILTSYTVIASYSIFDKLEYFFKTNNIVITDKLFTDNVTINISINDANYNILKETFQNHISIIKK